MINLKINGIDIQVKENTTILDAAKLIDVDIPTLCHVNVEGIKYKNNNASCRVCIVENVDNGKLLPSCATLVKEGMNISTNSLNVINSRRNIVELILSDHPNSCLTCAKNLDCELQELAENLGIREIKYEGEMNNFPIDTNSKSIVRDPNKCILCKRCETMCNDMQTVGAISQVGRGFSTTIGTTFNRAMDDTTCTFCGQCLAVCPTGALTEINNTRKVIGVLRNEKKHVVVQTAPAVRVALGEMFDMEVGTNVTGKMVAALRQLGFDRVFDTNFAADLTIMEEASEFVDRIENNGTLPILTSCCPGWVNFLEQQFTDFLDIPSSCKSPHEMMGVITKTYYAEKQGIDPKDIVVVSIMPCVAKKYEAAREELSDEYGKDVDVVLTTRELAELIKEFGINFLELDDEEFDNPLGESTGAGTIFGASGGVIEATVRTAYEWITKETLEEIDFVDLRGFAGIKEATVNIGGTDINIAVANGLGSARKLLESIRDGSKKYHAIEIMACPGGCIGGAGQPYHKGNNNILRKRAEAIYEADREKTIRKSHENPYIKKLYDEYLGEPYGDKAHKLLHTTYTARPKL